MTSLVMLHGANQRSAVWRFVSDNLSPSWGVVAPNLHGYSSLDALYGAIIHDLSSTHIDPPLYVVGTGEAAIPALRFVAHNLESGDIAGLFLSGPRVNIGDLAVRAAAFAAHIGGKQKRTGRGKRAAITNATRVERAGYVRALYQAQIAEYCQEITAAGVPVRIVAGTKDRGGTAGARKLRELIPSAEFFSIELAEADWNAYAPANFAANVAEFIEQVEGAGNGI